MKITVKNEAEAKAKLLSKYKTLAKEFTADEAAEMVKAYVEKNEFVTEDGHSIKMEFCSAENMVEDQGDMKAMIASAIKDGFASIEVKTSGKRPNVEVGKDDWEQLIEDPKYGFKNMGEFGKAIMNAGKSDGTRHVDKRLALMSKADQIIKTKATPTTFSSELTGADGGFAVPPEYSKNVKEIIDSDEGIWGNCDVAPTESNVVNISVDEVAPWDNSQGIQVFSATQGSTMTQSKVVLQDRQVILNKLYALCPVTEELINDGARLNDFLMNRAPKKIRYQLDEKVFRGTGNGEALGFENANSLVVKGTTSSSGTYSVADISNMFASVLATNSDAAGYVWYMSPSARAYLPQLTLGTTLGFPVGLVGQSVEGAPLGTLYGLPIKITQHCKQLGTQGDIALVNLKEGYLAYEKTGGVDFASSIHLFFDSQAVAFRWTMRYAGEPLLKAVVTPANETGKYSHFIELATR